MPPRERRKALVVMYMRMNRARRYLAEELVRYLEEYGAPPGDAYHLAGTEAFKRRTLRKLMRELRGEGIVAGGGTAGWWLRDPSLGSG